MQFKNTNKKQNLASEHVRTLVSSSRAGFTLLEMLVAVGLFAIVMLVAVGSLVSIIGANRRAQAQQDVVNNLAFALENMTRNIRTGTTYHCGEGGVPIDVARACPNPEEGDTYLAFEGQNGNENNDEDQIVFRFNDQDGVIERSLDSGDEYAPLTSPAVTVERLRFYVDGIPDGQPQVRIITGGFITDERGNQSRFDIDTLVSQRALQD